MITVLTDAREFTIQADTSPGEELWLSARDAESATGWVPDEEGLCKDGVCVPLPLGREREFVRGLRVNLAALWRHLGRPVAHSARGHVWVLGQSAEDRATVLRSLEAPDFTLPDPTGRLHSLSDHRGTKVLLVTWASW